MAAKSMPGYFSKLTNILEASDRVIPIEDAQTLLARLDKDGDFTTLLIQDTVGYEVIKVLNYQGNLAVDRGLSGTTPKRFPMGSCVVFTPSDELTKAQVCEVDCCETGVDETYGDDATVNKVPLEQLPTVVLGGISAVLGEPTGFMLINGKKVPYYD